MKDRKAGIGLAAAGKLELLETVPGKGDVAATATAVSLTSSTGFVLPTVTVEVDAVVVGSRVSWKVRHRYVNPTDDALEVVYRFPLPPTNAVVAMKATFADVDVVAELFERDRARRDYAIAVTSGRSAALVEEEHPSTFTATLGHLPAGAEACIELSLAGRVDMDVEEPGVCVGRLRFPTVVAPRFGEQAVASALSLAPPVCRWSVEVRTTSELLSVAANVPGVFTVSQPDAAWEGTHAVLNGSTPADRDVAVCWRYVAPLEPVVSVTFDSSAAGDRSRRRRAGGNATVCVEFCPPASTSTRPREIVVVLDRSGSMEGWKMQAAKRFVDHLIGSLTVRDLVSVAAFDTTLDLLTTGLVSGSSSCMAQLADKIAAIEARGGTDAAPALRWAARQFTHTPGTDAFLVLVTDGHVSGEDECVRALGPDVRVVAVGVDAAANLGLLNKLAAFTGGDAVCVSTPDEVSSAFTSALARLAPPALDDIVVELVSKTGRMVEVELHGPTVSFEGSVALLTGRCSISKNAKMSALVSGTDRRGTLVSFETPVLPGAACDTVLWARRRIRELEDEAVTSAVSDDFETDIVDLSLGFCTLSRFTAFVAVDAVSRTKRSPVPCTVGRELPNGWSRSSEVVGGIVPRSFQSASHGLSPNTASFATPVSMSYSAEASRFPSTLSHGTQSSSTPTAPYQASVQYLSAGPMNVGVVAMKVSSGKPRVPSPPQPAAGEGFVERLEQFVAQLATGMYDWGSHVDLAVEALKLSATSKSSRWVAIASTLERLRQDPSTWPEFEMAATAWLAGR